MPPARNINFYSITPGKKPDKKRFKEKGTRHKEQGGRCKAKGSRYNDEDGEGILQVQEKIFVRSPLAFRPKLLSFSLGPWTFILDP
jgi:hypothetical protein